MRKRIAIPLSIFLGLVFLLIVFGIIGANIEPAQQKTNETPVSQAEAENTETEPAEAPETVVIVEKADTDKTESAVPPPAAENLLMKATLIEAPVLNGLRQRIGTRAYITMPQEVLLKVVSLEDVGEFYRSFQGKGYNWVSIICPEGTGIVFPAAGSLASYGEIDREGRLAENIHWNIIYDDATGAFKEFKKP